MSAPTMLLDNLYSALGTGGAVMILLAILVILAIVSLLGVLFPVRAFHGRLPPHR